MSFPGAVLVIVMASAAAGCSLGNAPAPSLAGPSELALSLALAASPDHISQDGASVAIVTVTARDAAGRPVRDLGLHADLLVNGIRADYGLLSSRTLFTGADGRASIAYVAPPPPPATAGADNLITILVTPIGTDFGIAGARSVHIRLMRPGVILPPNGTPVAAFFFSPQQPHENDLVQFDASGSTDDGEIASYVWSFGDGGSGSGVHVSHRYSAAGSYLVLLTIKDDRDLSASSPPTAVTVLPAADPQAGFTASPINPLVGAAVIVNASASSVPAGRNIAGYEWDFGDGGTASGLTSSHVYRQAGTFTIVLTITDSTGRKGSTSKTITVGGTPGSEAMGQ